MVARVNSELLSHALLTPQPEPSDSDDVLLALETARALETQGELFDAARWLRRAVDAAEQQGDDERVLVIARAAADMSTLVGSSPPPAPAEAPTLPPPAPDTLDAGDALDPPAAPVSPVAEMLAAGGAEDTPTTPAPPAPEMLDARDAQSSSTTPAPASPDMLDASDAQYAPTTPPPAPFEPTMAPSTSAASTLPPPFPASATISTPPDMPFAERSMRIGAIRVAILEASIRGAKSFFVERLEKGQPPPAGSTEAMLVFTGEAEDAVEQEVNLLASSDSIMR